MNKKISLTAERIRVIEPEGKRFFVYDTNTPGLRLQITPKGTKTFQLYINVPGHDPATLTIGRFPKVSLKNAQQKAKHESGQVSLYGQKAVDAWKVGRDEQTFKQLFESWFEDQQALGRRDLVNVRSRYQNHILPTLGNKKPSSLIEKYLNNWFLKLPRRKKAQGQGTISNTTANRCLEIVSAVFAAKTSSNPADSIKHFPEESRERYLSGDELGRLFDSLNHPDTPPAIKDIVLLALTTGGRKFNILSMRWTDIRFEDKMWVIPASSSKNNKSMGVPLIPEAQGILERIKLTTKSIFVFPSQSKKGHVVDIRRAWKSILKRAEITNLVFHDLRRTAGSWQAHIGSSDLIIGKSLGHSSTQSTRVYARLRDNNPIRDSMANGFAAMVKASRKKKIIGIK